MQKKQTEMQVDSKEGWLNVLLLVSKYQYFF